MESCGAKILRCIIGTLLILSPIGCATPSRLLAPLCPAPVPSAENLLAPLRQRARPIESLKLTARVTVRRSGRLGRGIFDATVFVRPPDLLRMRAYRNVTFMVFDLLADDKGIRMHDALQKRFYKADYQMLDAARSPWAGLTPALLMDALAVENTVLDRAAQAQSANVRRRWRTIELSLEGPYGRLQVCFDRTGQNIIGLTYQRPTDQRATTVKYGDLIAVEGARLPQWLEVEIGPSRVRMTLEVSKYEINGKVGPQIAVLQPPPGQQWLPLEVLK